MEPIEQDSPAASQVFCSVIPGTLQRFPVVLNHCSIITDERPCNMISGRRADVIPCRQGIFAGMFRESPPRWRFECHFIALLQWF
jgi:hypothetical protein